jgi:hypothetical protein
MLCNVCGAILLGRKREKKSKPVGGKKMKNNETLTTKVFNKYFCDEHGDRLSGHPDLLCVRREIVIEDFPETRGWSVEGEHTDRFGYVLGNGIYLFPDFDHENPVFTAI